LISHAGVNENMKRRLIPYAVFALISSIALLVVASPVKAQEPSGDKIQKLAQVLGLSPQQKSQLAPIVEAEAPKIQAIEQNPSLSPKEKLKQIQAVHSQTDPLVKNILNPNQYQMWQQIRKDELAKIKSGGS
jgi:hypothetical protein